MRRPRGPVDGAATSRAGDQAEDRGLALWRVEARGCPACVAAHQAELNSVTWFLRENYRQAETLTALVRRRFCRQHLAMLLASGAPHLGVTLEYLAMRQAQTLERFRNGILGGGLRPWRRLTRRRIRPHDAQPADQPERCQFCAAGRTAATVAIADTIELLGDEQGRAAYRSSDGLCCPHAWIALREAPDAVSDWLAADLQHRLRAAEAQIEEWYRLLRSRGPQEAGHPVWAAAAHLLWGGVGTPARR